MNEKEELTSKISVYFDALDIENKKTVIKFAKFLGLSEQKIEEPLEIDEPENIIRPEVESVVSAIKRLRKTYPMLSSDSLMNQVSEQMSAHLVRGRTAIEAIDALEMVFSQKYREVKNV